MLRSFDVPPSAPADAAARRDTARGWLSRGLSGVAIAAVGIGVGGSLAFTGTAHGVPSITEVGGIASIAPQPSLTPFAEGATRPEADPDRIQHRADWRAEKLQELESDTAETAVVEHAAARDRALASVTKATSKERAKLQRDRSDAARGCVPVRGHYTIAARFGAVGAWARYHTGFDFSAPVGTTLRAPAAGVVTNAGSGPASGWAGNYVVIKHDDGSQTLMAHMSAVTVDKGERVSACDKVGAVGMTGRTFGPHVHFEVYPKGAEPGDVYAAVDPAPWMKKRHIKP